MAPTQARRLRPVSASLAGVGRQVGAARAPEPVAGPTVVFSVQRQLARPRECASANQDPFRSFEVPEFGKEFPRSDSDRLRVGCRNISLRVRTLLRGFERPDQRLGRPLSQPDLEESRGRTFV